MEIVELHGAFAWDCPACGRENFERAIEGNIDEPALQADENQVVGELIAPGVTDAREDLMESEVLIQRILLAPARVTCRACGAGHGAEVPTSEES